MKTSYFTETKVYVKLDPETANTRKMFGRDFIWAYSFIINKITRSLCIM